MALTNHGRHYTLHSKAVITKPQNVHVLRDIQCDGYVCGADMTFFGDVSYSYSHSNSVPNWDSGDMSSSFAQHIQSDIRERLEFEHDIDNRYPSILCFCVPLEDGGASGQRWKQDAAFSLANGTTAWDVGPDNGRQTWPGGSQLFDGYNKLFGLSQITQGVDPSSMQGHAFIRSGSANNAIVLQGPYRAYSPFTQSHFDLSPGQGHFGPDALPGVSG